MKRYAIFFPQFHRVKVNDEAWGDGFTDWALVATANAFDYWNRRAPACGFYDLSNPNEVQAQFASAASAGLDGFGIYHYRFEDGPELDAVERYLRDANLPERFGYFFIWANENWSKRWAGKDTELLKVISTKPTREQVRDHVNYLKPYMENTHYTCIDGKPVFVIYRPDFFLNPAETLNFYREEFQLAGIDPAIGYFLKSSSEIEYSKLFDFCYLFEPRLFQNFSGLRKNRFVHLAVKKLIHTISYSKVEYLSSVAGKFLNRGSQSRPFSQLLEYFGSAERKKLVDALVCPVQNVLTCGWNNAPRYRDRFTEVKTPTPEQFSSIVADSLADPGCSDHIPLLCNAWNEWSEGAAIEPCSYLGDALLRSYLDSNKS